jgi:hypothetical protein
MFIYRLASDAKVRGSQFADVIRMLFQIVQNEPTNVLAACAYSSHGQLTVQTLSTLRLELETLVFGIVNYNAIIVNLN